MEKKRINPEEVVGWGVDADPENEPTYPMKEWTGDDHSRIHYERAEQQPVDVEILHSNERPSVTAVFGHTVPPSGVSGAIRRFAFRFTESEYGHWLPLLLADRVQVVEGLVDDLKKGYVPNIFAERGWGAEWKHNKKGAVQKLVITAALAAGVTYWLARRKKR